MSQAMPDPVRRLLSGMPVLKPVIPDPGIPFQLVHEDDVAQAFVAGVHGKGEPGAVQPRRQRHAHDVATWPTRSAGTRSRSPTLAVDATAEVVARLPAKPPALSWIESIRKPVLMKTDRAKKLLGWKPKHTSKGTLKELVAAYRASDDEDERVH